MKHYKIINHFLCNKHLAVKDDNWTIDYKAVTCKNCKSQMKKILSKDGKKNRNSK